MNVALEDLEPEIVCVNLRTGKAEGMGVINSPTYSYSIIVNLQAARKALSSECCLAKGNNSSTNVLAFWYVTDFKSVGEIVQVHVPTCYIKLNPI